jgi:hypothetical protein
LISDIGISLRQSGSGGFAMLLGLKKHYEIFERVSNEVLGKFPR